MGAFNSAVITAKGQALLAKVIAGSCDLEFTNIKISANTYSTNALASLTGIGTIKQSAAVASVTRVNSSNVKVSASFDNTSLTAGYYVRTIGLYATDPTDGEILYSVATADETDATADWMPPYNGVGSSSLLVDLVTAVSNASSVTVEVDPSAVATVTQINNLQDQIDTLNSFVGYEEDDVYGVEVDYSNKTFTRLAGAENLTAGDDFDNITPWGGRKRCIVTNDGVVLAYYGETGYTETGALTTALTVNEVEYPVGTAVQVMVEQPIFYTKTVPVSSKDATSGRGKQGKVVRYYISPTPKSGFTPMRGFRDANGHLQDKIYLAAFEGCLYDTSASAYITDDSQVMTVAEDLLSSIAKAIPASGLTQSLTRANARTLANNRGDGWQLSNIFSLTATQWLILVEYASFNAQSKIGKGVSNFTDDGSTNMAIKTGGTSSLGNASGIDPDGTDGECCVSYRGEENLWGNIWTWLDAINAYNTTDESTIYLKEYGTFTDDTADGYTALEFEAIQSSGYISAFGVDSDMDQVFIPTEHSGSSSLPVSDYIWNQNTGWRVAILGGIWDSGLNCGAWCLSLNYASSARYRIIGGRLLYVPQSAVA